ncbi:MAG: XTP/dITP diphosphatase [Anaeroplasmataceae bacterium]|nr:XTP/dITP diphosphatase [Anaeroplasmataceae bacterium]
MDEVVLATRNKGKLREFKNILPFINILDLDDIGYEEEIIENGRTFEENAKIKAQTLAKRTNMPVLADDSGLEVDALNGAPGIYSARYAKNGHDDEANNQLLIKNLKGKTNRTARYVCAICLYYPDDRFYVVRGTCEGEILKEAKGQEGFGYDPYFYSTELKKCFGEIPLEEKNKVSHRFRAIQKIKEFLK